MYATSSVLINFTASDASGVSAKWYYNGSANVSYSSPNIITLGDGSYNFVFYANDTVGNVGSSSVSFTVDTTPGGGSGGGDYLFQWYTSTMTFIMGLQENTLNVTGTVYADTSNLDTLKLRPRSTAPNPPSLGLLYVDSDSNELCFYDGSSWTGLKIGGACS